jgi:hypothetical protein
MMWPGSLIAVSERFPGGGVIMFAMMAAGGDMGAAVGPQLVGVITDTVKKIPFFASKAAAMGLDADSFGMKIGILIGMLFSLAAIAVFYTIMRKQKSFQENKAQ